MFRDVVLMGICALLLGCSTASPSYEVMLRDGRRIEATHWPQLNDTTGYYRCEQPDGSLVQFHEAQVTSISAR